MYTYIFIYIYIYIYIDIFIYIYIYTYIYIYIYIDRYKDLVEEAHDVAEGRVALLARRDHPAHLQRHPAKGIKWSCSDR